MSPIEKLYDWLETTPYQGVVLGRRDNYKWLTGGYDNAVVTNVEVGVAYLVVTDKEILLVADSSDSLRMLEEQNPLQAKGVLVPWYQTVEAYLIQMCREKNYVADTHIDGTTNIQEMLIDMRMGMDEATLDKYREVGQQCAKIVETIAAESNVGDEEISIANKVKAACIVQGISPDCVLVGSDERILKYRHPMPTKKLIRNSLMIVLGGEKYGLNVSITRMVCFGSIPEEMQERMEKTQYVFAQMQMQMRDNMTYQAYFKKIQEIYESIGYKDEWRMHHQGGPTGYGCREFVVLPECEKILKKNQVYAWNPTICGTKCEETTYFGTSGIEILTRTEKWPCKNIKTEHGSVNVTKILQK